MTRPNHSLSRRRFILGGAAAGIGAALPWAAHRSQAASPPALPARNLAELASLTVSAAPITREKHGARIEKLQALLIENRVGAFAVEAGSSLRYFTGIDWWRSERTTVAVIPAHGDIIVVTPAFEEPSIRETLKVPGDVRPWNEDENPFALVVQSLQSRGVRGGPIAVESTMRYFLIDGIQRVSKAYAVQSADAIVRACRLIKSPAELQLLQLANHVTIEALRFVHDQVTLGMTRADIEALMDKATRALGGDPQSSMTLLNEASAYPHGSHALQTVREQSTILMDCGCLVHGYESDISRTWVYGEASPKQRKVWETVKRGQEIALESAKLGAPVGRIDDAVRSFYVAQGWGRAIACRDCRIAPAMASDWTGTSLPIWYMVTRLRLPRACAFPTNRAYIFRGSSACAWKIVGT